MYIFYSFKASINTMPSLKQFLQYRKSGLSVGKIKKKTFRICSEYTVVPPLVVYNVVIDVDAFSNLLNAV